jgi:hypothetical protein
MKIVDKGELKKFQKDFPLLARRAVVQTALQALPVAKQAILDSYNVPEAEIDKALRVSESNNSSWWSGKDNPRASIIARGKGLNLMMFRPQQTATGVQYEIRKGRKNELRHAFITETTQGYGRAGGQSKKLMRKVLRNLSSDFGKGKLKRDSGKWVTRAGSTLAKYEEATRRYQLQRAILRAAGATWAGVFARKTHARLPIRAIYGGSVQQFFGSGIVKRKIGEFVTKALPENLTAEMKRYFGGV